jgi:endoglycosylceramidase
MAERMKFQDFYDRLALAIRKVDTVTPIFFEPITFDNAIPVGFNYPPGGNRFRNLSVFSYHFYKPPALGFNTIDYRVKDGKRLGLLSFLSEFGDSSSDVLQRAQKYHQSWLHWIYKPYGKNWGSKAPSLIQGERVNANLSMTYLQRTAGELID